jgi:hypothetical protein
MITLITPPDIFENENTSFTLMNISDEEQEQTSIWLSNNNIDKQINLYYYQGEADIPWLLHAVAISKGVYLNCENNSDITKWITSYILGKSNVWYKTYDPNFKALMNYINQKQITDITEFLKVQLGK